jgi:GNAT superfamily N-acetyltransferase
MEIRELHPSELNDLLELYTHLHETDLPLPEREEVEAVWREIQRNPRLEYFGLYEESRLVASCILSIIPNLTRGCRPYGLIENVVTHRDFRRRGYGRSLLEFVLQYAWERNCYKVMLMTGRKSEEVYRFYESAGFDRQSKQAFYIEADFMK